MSDREREDNDIAWLLARAKGQPGPSISEDSAARYEKLESLLASLPEAPEGAAPREGWQDRVFAAIDAEDARKASASSAARGLRKPWLLAVGTVVVVAAGGLVLMSRGPTGAVAAAPRIEVEVEPGASNQGAMGTAMIGDTMVARAVLEGPGELRVYDAAGVEVARCAAPAEDCSIVRDGTHTTLRLSLVLRAQGTFQPVVFSPALGGAPAGLDLDGVAARKANVDLTRGAATVVH